MIWLKHIINSFCFCFLIFQLSFCEKGQWVFSIKDSVYSENVLIDFYGKSSWVGGSSQQKSKMVEDFLVREGAFLTAREKKLNLSPSFVEKIYTKKRQLLVNYVYQLEVAQLGLDSLRFSQGLEYLKKDLLVHHLLFGYSGSALRVPVERTKEDSYSLCVSILDTITFSSLPSLAVSFSDDGSAKRNSGRLGWLSWGSTVPSFEAAVFSGKEGDFIGPIETNFGYHIAYIEKERKSDYANMSEEDFLDALLLKSSVREVNKLKTLSASYDSLELARTGVVFNDSLILKMYNSFNGLKRVNKNDILSVLKNLDGGVVCSFDGDAIGLDWFIDRLSFYEPSNRPNIQDLNSFYSIFKTLLLQELAYLKGIQKKLNKKSAFIKQVLSYEKDLLYTMYFKNLVNNVSFPDSTSIKDYYQKNLTSKYTTPESLVLQEIRVNKEALADSILNLYIDGREFSSLVKDFSLDYSIEKRGAHWAS